MNDDYAYEQFVRRIDEECVKKIRTCVAGRIYDDVQKDKVDTLLNRCLLRPCHWL